MNRIKAFVKTAFLGGIIVLLPLAILLYFAIWMVRSAADAVEPLADLLTDTWDLPAYIAVIIIFIVILIGLFLIGMIVRTAFGGRMWKAVENRIMRWLPGYTMIREVVVEMFATGRPAFSSVALVQIGENDVLATGFITDEHPDGCFTVFVPTGPNPTSGNIYHLKPDQVHIVNIPVEIAWKSIIGCGAGSKPLLNAYRRER